MAKTPEEYDAFQAHINSTVQHYKEVQKKEGDVSPIAECLIRLEGIEVTDFSSQYGSETSISYVASNLAGKPCIFPSYGDYTEACVFRTYGPWWKIAPSNMTEYHGTPADFTSEDFIEVAFAEYLYPVRIEVYETYNPGAVVRIMACDSAGGTDTDRGKRTWVTLWSGQPTPCRQNPRIFAPHLKKINFPTNLIRLELNHTYMDYYTELDGIKLVGMKTPPSQDVYIHRPVLSVEGGDGASFNLATEDRGREDTGKSALCCTPWWKTENPLDEPFSQLSLDKNGHEEDGHVMDEEDFDFFAHLPKELIQLILEYLHIRDLCRLAQTCSLLREHCYDPLLYTDLNLQPFWTEVTSSTLLSLIPRCERLQRLNLSWVGKGGHIHLEHLVELLRSCPPDFHTLELKSCTFADSRTLMMITGTCPQLVELNLSSCTKIDDFSIFNVAPFKKLKRLNVYRTLIDFPSIVAILRACPDLEHLNIASCQHLNPYINLVIMEIGLCCKNLRTLDMWRLKSLNAEGLSHLYKNCLLLEELDVGWCIDLKADTGCFVNLAFSCKNLKKLFLTANRTVRDADLLALAKHCPHLEQLDILGTREVSKGAVVNVLEFCKKLILLDVSFCVGISAADTIAWRASYPNVAIKKSFQNISVTF